MATQSMERIEVSVQHDEVTVGHPVGRLVRFLRRKASEWNAICAWSQNVTDQAERHHTFPTNGVIDIER
jgi:hypothetical protein